MLFCRHARRLVRQGRGKRSGPRLCITQHHSFLFWQKPEGSTQGTQNPEAYELYLKGRYYWNKRTVPDLETSISYFDQAIAKDPGYALAYSGAG